MRVYAAAVVVLSGSLAFTLTLNADAVCRGGRVPPLALLNVGYFGGGALVLLGLGLLGLAWRDRGPPRPPAGHDSAERVVEVGPVS
jgi:hypothetical protein